MTPNFRPQTQRGYDLFEVSSALQKTIRRGLEEEAVYWALELLPRYEAYLWKRIKTVANEDVGVANPIVFAAIEALANQYAIIKDTLAVVNAVVLLCRSPKTRLACHLSIVVEQEIAQGKPKREIPDFALDMHTGRGKSLGRTTQPHFRKVGAKLENKIECGDVWEDRCYKLLETKVAYQLKDKGKPAPGPKKCDTSQSLFGSEEEDPGPDV